MPKTDGQFKKGNPGKPKGAKSKVTKTLRSMIGDFLENNWQSIEDDLKKLKPKDRVTLYERLLNYALPKYQNFSLESMSEQDLEKFEQYLLEKNGWKTPSDTTED